MKGKERACASRGEHSIALPFTPFMPLSIGVSTDEGNETGPLVGHTAVEWQSTSPPCLFLLQDTILIAPTSLDSRE